MKKTIELDLNLNDPFFNGLKEKILEMNGVSGFDEYINSIIQPVMNATLKTLKDLTSQSKSDKTQLLNVLADSQNKSKVTFSYEHQDNVYPSFHHILEENIDVSLNRRIHTSTLERITNIVENFMSDYSDKLKQNKKIKTEPLVDPDKELVAIVNYITTTWNGFSDEKSQDFFKTVWDNSNHVLKNHFDQYIFLDFIKNFYELKDFNEFKINGVSNFELPMYFLIAKSKLHDLVSNEWRYDKNVNEILYSVKAEFPFATKAKPKNWNKLAKNYVDYEGMSELNGHELKKLFGGMDSGTAGCPSFEIRTALPHVIYDDKCQGRKPLEVLVGAMLGHAYVMNEKNNATKMLKEWIDLKEQIDENPGQDITFEFKEPLNQALFNLIKDKCEVNPKTLKILGLDKNTNKKKM